MKMNQNKLLPFTRKVIALFRFTSLVLTWILLAFKLEVSKPLKLFDPLIDNLIRSAHRGQTGFFEYVKKVRTSLLLYLSGEFPSKRVVGIKLTSDGIPKALGPLVPIVRLKLRGEIRLILTILYATRSFKLGKDPDVQSIIAHSKKEVEGDYTKHLKSFWRTLGYKQSDTLPRSVLFKNYHWSTKSGPNGQAMFSGWTDLCNLTDTE
jgi:hypothetical protein